LQQHENVTLIDGGKIEGDELSNGNEALQFLTFVIARFDVLMLMLECFFLKL
jgi:hypothetical protein